LPETTPVAATQDDPNRIVEEIMDFFPDSSSKAYDMRKIIKMFADDDNYFEIQAEYAPNLTVGFAGLMDTQSDYSQ
jgi:propionyl-CoA carboxylase beta chain